MGFIARAYESHACDPCVCVLPRMHSHTHWCGINTFLHHRTRRRRSHSARKCAQKPRDARTQHTDKTHVHTHMVARVRQVLGGRTYTHARVQFHTQTASQVSEYVCLDILNGCVFFFEIKSKSYGKKFISRSYFYRAHA